MRLELSLDLDANGDVTNIGWLARDPEGELLAIGCHLHTHVPADQLERALAYGLEQLWVDVERNGGVQQALSF